MNLRRKVHPATNVIAKGKENKIDRFFFKIGKRKATPDNDEASDNRKPPAIRKPSDV